jgi:hypothetical protein
VTTSTLVPALLPCAINGRPYLIEPTYERTTLDVIRQQSDAGDAPGEHSLSPYGLWRRSRETWHHGAGQVFADAKDSDEARYRSSKGIDPWTRGQISLLPTTASIRTSSNTNLALAVVGYPLTIAAPHLILADGNEIYESQNATPTSATWTTIDIHAGQAAQAVQSITTNGSWLWAAVGSSGIHRWPAGGSSAADRPAGTFTLVGWALGRLLAANVNVLYEVTSPLGSPPPTPTTLHTHPDTGFVWNIVAPGRNVIYAAGNASGQTGTIYKITLEDVSTALGAPSVATYLPDGETINALQFYAGAVILGTGRGLRIGTADGQGNIDYGPLIETPRPVYAIEPQGRYCWFAWSNYDGTSTGLGRVDLGFFNESLVPAWSSDLMATDQGDVLSVVSFTKDAHLSPEREPNRVFAVSGKGVYIESSLYSQPWPLPTKTSTKVASGTLESGSIRFGTTESKNLRSVDLRHHALDGTVAAAIQNDDISYATAGTSSTPGSQGSTSPFATDTTAETAELRFTLARPTDSRTVTAGITSGSTTLTITVGTFTSADVGRTVTSTQTGFPSPTRIASVTSSTIAVMADAATATASGFSAILSPTTAGPEMVRWTLKALPKPKAPETFTVTIEMRSTIDTTAGDGQPYAMDVPTEVAAIKTLEQNRTVVDFQLGSDTFSVYVLKSQFKGEHWEGPRRRFSEGKMTVLLQTVAE